MNLVPNNVWRATILAAEIPDRRRTMARPRTGSDNTLRSNVRALRLDDAERAAIEKAAGEAGLSVSELMRQAVLRDIGYLQAV